MNTDKVNATTTLDTQVTTNGAGTSTPSHRKGPTAISFDTLPDTAYIRQPQVLEVVPFSAATLWRKCGSGDFPRPIKLSERVTAWNAGLVRAWLKAQAR